MNKKKILNFIEELKTMANNLDDVETAAEPTYESSMPAIPAVVQETAEVTPYATDSSDNRPNELHCYKGFSLPENITVQVDVLKKSTKTVIELFEGVKTFTGLKPVLIYNPDKANTYFGQGFSLNAIENLKDIELVTRVPQYTGDNTKVVSKCVYVDSLGDEYSFYNGYVSGMYVSLDPPEFAENSEKVLEFFSEPLRTYWMIRGGITKAFDNKARLVYALDTSGNYTQIHYDSTGKITKVVDGNENIKYAVNEYSFEYSSGYLSKISESRNGKSVTFSYNNGKLRYVKYSDGRMLYFSYTTNTLTVDSTDSYIHTVTSSNTSVNITSQSAVEEIPAGGQVTDLPNIVDYKITLGTGTAKITDTDGNSEYYKFTSDGQVSEYYKEVNSVVSYAEKSRFRFTAGSSVYSVDTYIAPNNILNQKPYSSFTFTPGDTDECKTSTYNGYNLLVLESHYYERMSDFYYMNTTKTLTYNDKGLLTKENINYCQFCIDEDEGETEQTYYTRIIDYEYDNDSRLKKRSSYFKGLETTDGKDVEEYGHYIEGGYWTEKVMCYNSLNSYNVFVAETVYDLYGNVFKQTDSTGLKCNVNFWGSKRDELSNLVTSNGTRTSYSYTNGKLTGVTRGLSKTNNISYGSGEVTEMSCDTSSISFTYNDTRRLSKVEMDGSNHYSISYSGETADPVWVKVTNAKNESYTCKEDKAHTYSEVYYGNTLELKTNYNKGGRIISEVDNLSNETVSYSYSSITNNMWGYKVFENGSETYYAYIVYNDDGRVFSIRQSGLTDISYGYAYEYGLNGRLNRIVAGSETIYIDYDKLGRYTGRRINVVGNILTESIQYKSVRESIYMGSYTYTLYRQSNLPMVITYSENDRIGYEYDDSGNITEINKNGKLTYYSYDDADRLIREDNKELGKSYFYTYDNKGNITKKETCEYTTGSQKVGTVTVIDYAYNDNKLTSFNGESCTYDSIGNPTTYRGKTATWKGRQLQSYNGTTFGYDGRGRRIYKNGVRYYYDYQDRLIRGNELYYFYDHIGVAGFRYGGTYYTYKRDVQNNVIAILDNNGNVVVEYKYDAWGNHTVSGSNITLGNLNPFRYRSYFYDTETGLYYLKTRYYDPEVGRFLNMDSVEYANPNATDGLNLYAYCGNNPVIYTICNLSFYSKNISLSFNVSIIPSVTQRTDYASNQSLNKKSLRFDVAFMDTDRLTGIPEWVYAQVLFANGSALNGLTLASIAAGVAKVGFRTPKWFGNNVSDDVNPYLYMEIGVITADASIGLTGFSAHAILLSAEAGLAIGNTMSVSGKVFVGYGISFDLSKGLKLGAPIGPYPIGFEISFEFDWLKVLFGCLG